MRAVLDERFSDYLGQKPLGLSAMSLLQLVVNRVYGVEYLVLRWGVGPALLHSNANEASCRRHTMPCTAAYPSSKAHQALRGL